MELNYLNEFITLANYKNFHAAARALNISQSTLTNHIKALEKEFHVTLFIRDTRNVELSEYGKIFQYYAESYVELYENCTRALHAKRHIDKVVLTIALEPHYFVGAPLEIFSQFQKAYENVVLEFVNSPMTDSRKMLRNGRCDIAIVPQERSVDPEFKTINLRTERAVVLVNSAHPFAQRQAVNIGELKDERLFVPPDRLVLHRLLTSVCRSAGFEPNIAGSGVSEIMGKMLTQEGLGIAIQSDYSSEKVAGGSMRIVKLQPELKWYVNLLYSDAHTGLTKTFLEFVLASLAAQQE